jgi:putative transposase
MNNGGERYAKGARAVLELQYRFAWKTKYSYKVLNGDIALRLRDLPRNICDLQKMTVVKGNIGPDNVRMRLLELRVIRLRQRRSSI